MKSIITLVVSRRVYFLAILLAFFYFLFGTTSFAQESCGDIIYPANYYYEGSEEDKMSITDCNNPFGSNGEVVDLSIDDTTVTEGGEYVVGNNGTSNYGFPGEGYFNPSNSDFYLHNGDNYIVVKKDFLPPTEEEVYRVALEYFNDNTLKATVYKNIYLADDRWSYFYDSELQAYYFDGQLGRRVEDVFNDFELYVKGNAKTIRPALLPGTYTVVVWDYSGGPVETKREDLRSRVLAWLLPTAYAYGESKTVTFTLLAEAPAPKGASSVLFLPGIQASRLYKDGLLGTEDQLWEPNINSDVAQLEMTQEGFSVNDIYTRDVVNEIFGIVNVYKTFLEMLSDMKEHKEIDSYTTFPYDWRYDVIDLVVSGTRYDTGIKSVIDEIEKLATTSYSKKVTIVAHSNGGLFAKAIMIELDNRNLSHLVDKVIFIGTPQLGTPKAIGVLLHAYGQKAGFGAIINDDTVRDVIRNMPGAYALLPSEEYFKSITDIVVSNDNSQQTEYLDLYNDIDTYSELSDFLIDAKNTRDEDVSINIPNTNNVELLFRTRDLHRQLDSWVASSTTKVFEIVGLGLPTIKGFDYRTFPCSVNMASLPCLNGGYSKPYPVFTTYGDETVVATSAAAYKGDKFTAYVDLQNEGEQLFVKQRQHSDITESPTVKEYVSSILKFGYQNESLEVPEDYIEVNHRYTIVGVHSPVDILAIDNFGKKIGFEDGTVLANMPGAQYIELADSHYVILPEGEYDIILSGYATGTFSLTIASLIGDTTKSIGGFFGASTTPNMLADFFIKGSRVDRMHIDSSGDSIKDYEVDLSTGQIVTSSSTANNSIKFPPRSVSATRVGKLPKPQVAGISLSKEEEYYQKLYDLLILIKQYLELIKKS